MGTRALRRPDARRLTALASIAALAPTMSLTLVFTSACSDTSTPAGKTGAVPKEDAKIQRALDRLTATEAPGAILLVREGNRTLRLMSGYGNIDKKTPMRATDRSVSPA
jgi:CubicO group peptidase (beta-lactamase class C family)